jgi:hypothetical protein
MGFLLRGRSLGRRTYYLRCHFGSRQQRQGCPTAPQSRTAAPSSPSPWERLSHARLQRLARGDLQSQILIFRAVQCTTPTDREERQTTTIKFPRVACAGSYRVFNEWLLLQKERAAAADHTGIAAVRPEQRLARLFRFSSTTEQGYGITTVPPHVVPPLKQIASA